MTTLTDVVKKQLEIVSNQQDRALKAGTTGLDRETAQTLAIAVDKLATVLYASGEAVR